MPKFYFRFFFTLIASTFFFFNTNAQSIYQVMENNNLTIHQVEAFAKKYFDSVGTSRGTGYKQYQRWLFEAKFHLDENGYQQPVEKDFNSYTNSPLTSSTQQWTEMGPFSWNRTSGWNPGVGRVTAIAVHPLDTLLMYLCSPGGGLWKSTTGGNSWQPLTDNNSSLMSMWAVAVDPQNTQIVYAGNSGGTIVKSINGGATFTTISSGSGISGTVRKILISPTNSNLIFVCSSSGIHRSTNAGVNWTQVHNIQKEDIEFKPDDENVLYATGNGSATQSVLYRSIDNGITWNGITSGLATFSRTLVAVSAANPNRVYLVQARGSELGYIFRSDDAGLNFTTMITGNSSTCTNYFGYETTGCGTGGQASYDMAMCVNPLNADEVHIAGCICWKSSNGGASWVAETAWSLPNGVGYNHSDVHVLNWVGKTIYSGSDGGIYKSVNYGDDWIDLSNGMSTRQFYRFANAVTNTGIFTGGAQDNGSTIKKGIGWRDWLGADGMDGLISPLDSNLIWGTSQNGSIYRSTNGGSSYSGLSKPPGGNWVTPLAIESKSNIIYGGWTGAYKSTNNGASWIKISDTVITANVVALAVAPSNPAYIYASVANNLYVTTDSGKTWSIKNAPSSLTINWIAVSPLNPEKIWLALNTSGAYRACVSIDAGSTFTDISAGLVATTARSVDVDLDSAETVYYGMNIGVYFKDKYSPWQNLTANLPQVAVNEVELQKSGKILRVATYGRGIWQRPTAGGYCGGNIITLPANLSGTAYQWEINTGSGFTNVTNNTIYSGATTPTLSINSATNMYNHQLRCKVTISGVPTYSQVYTLKFAVQWWGEFDTNWSNPANWSCGLVPDENTDVVIGAEKPRYPIVSQNVMVRSLHVARNATINVQTGFELKLVGQ